MELELLQQRVLLVLVPPELLLQRLPERQLHNRQRHKLKCRSCCSLELLRIRHRLERLRSCCSLVQERSMLGQLHKQGQLRSRLALACSTLPSQACT